MDIFITGIPPQATDTDLKNFLQPLLQKYSITTFDHVKTKNKGCGFLYVPSKAQAEVFLRSMSSQCIKFPGMCRFPVTFQMSNRQDGGTKIKILQAETQLKKLNLGTSSSMSIQTLSTKTSTNVEPVVQTQDHKQMLAVSNAFHGASVTPP